MATTTRPRTAPVRLPSSPKDQAERQAQAAADVLRQFRMVFNAVRKHFRELEKSAGLGGAQVWALSEIGRNPGMGVTELAATMDVHQSTASNLVRGLLARALIRTEQGVEDRRAVKLWILPSGKTVLRRVPGPSTGVLPKALQELDAVTLERLRREMGALIKVLGVEADREGAARTLLADM